MKTKYHQQTPLFILLFSLLLSATTIIANPFTTGEIGIDEKLDTYIPLDLKFSNEKNQLVTLQQLITKPTVLSFVYFDCPGLCSPLQQGISDLIEHSNLQLGKDYNVITISFNYLDNPEKAVEKKRNFVAKISKDKASSWYYLTADSATIIKILNAVGYKIKITGVDYVHPSAIVLLSPEGKITRYLYGLSFLPLDFKMAIIEAQKGISQPSINKVLEFCYAYDPDSKRYVLEITKLAGFVILSILIVFFSYLFFKSKSNKSTEIN